MKDQLDVENTHRIWSIWGALSVAGAVVLIIFSVCPSPISGDWRGVFAEGAGVLLGLSLTIWLIEKRLLRADDDRQAKANERTKRVRSLAVEILVGYQRDLSGRLLSKVPGSNNNVDEVFENSVNGKLRSASIEAYSSGKFSETVKHFVFRHQEISRYLDFIMLSDIDDVQFEAINTFHNKVAQLALLESLTELPQQLIHLGSLGQSVSELHSALDQA